MLYLYPKESSSILRRADYKIICVSLCIVDSYEVHFDDGFGKVLKNHRISKAVAGTPMQSSPLFDPVKSSKQERRDRKRKINVAALFGKKARLLHTKEKQVKKASTSTDNVAVNTPEDKNNWMPK